MSHKYYSPLRPLSLGTFPKPQGNEILHIENFKERQNVPEIARQAWGYIEYKEALTEIEAAAYELIPSNCISEMENLEARAEVTGKIKTGSYESQRTGSKVYYTEVVANSVGFGESKAEAAARGQQLPESDGFMNIPEGADEELPFN